MAKKDIKTLTTTPALHHCSCSTSLPDKKDFSFDFLIFLALTRYRAYAFSPYYATKQSFNQPSAAKICLIDQAKSWMHLYLKDVVKNCSLYAMAFDALTLLRACESSPHFATLFADQLLALKMNLYDLTKACMQHDHHDPLFLGMHDQHIQHEMQHIISMLASIISKASSRACNYFGAYNASIYVHEINMMADHLQQLIACATSMQPYACTLVDDMHHSHSISATKEDEDENGITARENITCSKYLFLKVFWLKHFQWAAAIDWLEFRRLFEQEYGIQHDYAMDVFYQAVCGGNQDMISMPVRRVSFDQLECLFVVHDWDCGIDYNATLFTMYHMHVIADNMLVLSGTLIEYTDIYDQHSLDDPYLLELVRLQYTPSTIVRELFGIKLESVSCGERHICVLTSTGQIYSWGHGDCGKLGHGDSQDQMCPKLVEFSKTVPMAHMSCGRFHTGAVSLDGQLYTWGKGMFGSLGLGNSMDCHSPCPVQGLQDDQVKSFHAGCYHSCVLTASGHVYTCGKSSLFSEGVLNSLVPLQVDAFIKHPAMQIACGGSHTLVLTKDGKIFAWGDNAYGQLGWWSDESPLEEPPTQVPGLPASIKQVAAGGYHSCVLSDAGELYVCGRNSRGQLGLKTSSHRTKQTSFIKVPGVQQPQLEGKIIREVACGDKHTMLLSDAYDVEGMGSNVDQQIGELREKKIFTPRKLQYFYRQKREVLQMSCGWGFSAFIVGKRVGPASLRKLCSDTIRNHEELWNLFLGEASAEQLRQQGISHDYAEIVRSMIV